MSRYIHKSHNVSVLLYHIVCLAKYRRVVIDAVVSDFYARGFERGYTPVVLRRLPERHGHAVVRVRPSDLQGTLADLEHTGKAVVPTKAFAYAFYDDQLAQAYLFMQDLVKFFGLLADFIVFIACLGLLGIASYTAETRTKEVGIRKVLGADVRSIIALLSRDYARLLLVAVVLGTPLAYLLTSFLLQGFARPVLLD